MHHSLTRLKDDVEAGNPPSNVPDEYQADGHTIIGRNKSSFNNRPIYGNNRDDVLIAGDRPIIRFGRQPILYGTLLIGITRSGDGFWLHNAEDITVIYQAGRISWTIEDQRLPGARLTVDAVPVVGNTGVAVRFQGRGLLDDDRLVWAFGGAISGINPNSAFDTVVSEPIKEMAFSGTDCVGNQVNIHEDIFAIHVGAGRDSSPNPDGCALGRCSAPTRLSIADGESWQDLSIFVDSRSDETPLLRGNTSTDDDYIYWGIIDGSSASPDRNKLLEHLESLFAAGWNRGAALGARVVVSTPEARLNALASVSVAAIDGTWYPPCFVHSAMLWNIPFPGWRTVFGGIMYGWPERVKETARYFIASQVMESNKIEAVADPGRLLTCQDETSRFYGKGRIQAHHLMYDMQSQFFDQIITAWRWSGDPELEEILRPALELHLEWMRDCFDPDGDGAYESYINSWPTDSVWYNGGGSCEATSYAFRGHHAALDMARRGDDRTSEALHRAALERIHLGFFKHLWIDRLGHPGKYREQGGHQRLHEDPWLYSIFLPIDADLLSPSQAASSLHYTATALQNDRKPDGGRMVWNSNWVPAIWSTRTDWPGDNYALALAYFQSGFGEDGWDIFKGTFLTTAYHSGCPGNLGHKAGGYDFGDCSHMFARTMIEGLFGYVPDYPNGKITLFPQFPPDWPEASLSIPDISISFRSTKVAREYNLALNAPALIEIRLPIRATGVIRVLIDNQPAPYELVPGMELGLVSLKLTKRSKASVRIETADTLPQLPPINIDGHPGGDIATDLGVDVVVALNDPQGVFEYFTLETSLLKGVLKDNPGQHLLLAESKIGSMPLWRLIRVNITKANDGSQNKIEVPEESRWHLVDLTPHYNCDVRTIFQQSYLSPRPDTVSLRLGTDGWTPWTSTYWHQKPPNITLDEAHLTGPYLTTSDGVRFASLDSNLNIAFTSLWDNFPSALSVPVNQEGESIWILIAGSTNPMQCHIANAIIRMHYNDGVVESLELIPPTNFWALAPLRISGAANGQEGHFDYDHPGDAFCVPKPHPSHLQLGSNCRAMIYGLPLRRNAELERVELETLSQEVVIGIIGISIMNPADLKNHPQPQT